MSRGAFTQRSRPKQKGLPSLGEQVDVVFPELKESSSQQKKNVPYRLPTTVNQYKIVPPSNRLWGRHGYDYYYNRISNSYQGSAQEQMTSSLSARQATIQANYPKFSHAMVSPVNPGQPRLYAGNVHDPAFFKNAYAGNAHIHSSARGYQRHPAFTAPAPTPTSRLNSPAKSTKTNYSADAIHWALSPYKKVHFDKNGGSQAQGPYSRSMTVTCAAPSNWLRMKCGRTKTVGIT